MSFVLDWLVPLGSVILFFVVVWAASVPPREVSPEKHPPE